MTDSIGILIVTAEPKAKKKASREHTEIAECGCQVTVRWFSESSRTVGIERCYQHPVR